MIAEYMREIKVRHKLDSHKQQDKKQEFIAKPNVD